MSYRVAFLAPKHARQRVLWRRRAETAEGNKILSEARKLACMDEYKDFTDGELIRLVYWGASGEHV